MIYLAMFRADLPASCQDRTIRQGQVVTRSQTKKGALMAQVLSISHTQTTLIKVPLPTPQRTQPPPIKI